MQEGEYLETEFNDYTKLAQNVADWTLFCPYSLQKESFTGLIKILSLPSIQVVYSEMDGGIMFDLVVPEACITFSVMKKISNKASVDEMKLSTGMITVIDDKKNYNFMHKDHVSIFDVSIKKSVDPLLIERLSHAIDHYFIDTDQKVSTLLSNLINTYTDKRPLENSLSLEIEKQVIDAMLTLTNDQEAKIPQFTPSEKRAITIKQQLFRHMDANVNISALAKKHNISERSLQNAFKSLYDITPTKFIRLLKLNHVHHELTEKSSKETSVIRVAQKWGFEHMGKFSAYYTELFGENPSLTLKNKNLTVSQMNKACVQRKEEL